MDLDQIIKRVEWLDEERRKDKMTIATLEERLKTMEGKITPFPQQLIEVNSEVNRVSTTLARMDQYDASLAQIRVDFTRTVESLEKLRTDHERETEKVRRVELESVNKSLGDIRKGLEPIVELKRGLQARQEEDFRLARLIEEVEQKVVATARYDEEYKRSIRLVEESVRQDSKRLTDLAGEVATLRKRADEQRGKIDLNADGTKKVEQRLSELQAAELERRQSQASFIEKQTLINVERDRIWKEWSVRFDQVEKVASGIDAQVQTLETLQHSLKHSQDSLDEVTQRFERRISEITEMQRLSEDRFRQEWVTFKADDQKRWTNYTLAQEEQVRETNRLFEKQVERLEVLEDLTHDLQDTLQQIKEETEKRLQSLLALAHDWMSTYEGVLGKM